MRIKRRKSGAHICMRVIRLIGATCGQLSNNQMIISRVNKCSTHTASRYLILTMCSIEVSHLKFTHKQRCPCCANARTGTRVNEYGVRCRTNFTFSQFNCLRKTNLAHVQTLNESGNKQKMLLVECIGNKSQAINNYQSNMHKNSIMLNN